MHNPNSELVATAFLRSFNISSSTTFGIGTTLPEDKLSWKDGFVQLQIVGGAPSIDVPTRRPLIQVDCWVPSINSSKPQWGKANTIAEDIVNALYEEPQNVHVVTGGAFKNALVQSAYVAREPRRISNDPAGHARYSFDMALTWIISNNVP